MPRTDEENQKIREAQREKILKAARNAFLRKGQSTTMADIAMEAGISQGLAYRYFKNKDDICLEVMRQMVSGDLFTINKVRASGGTPVQRMEMVISGLLKRVEKFEITIQAAFENDAPQRHLDFFHITFHHMMTGNAEEREIAQILERQFIALRALIRELIEEGQKAGEFIEENPDKLTVMVFTSIKGLTSLAIRRPDQFEAYYPYTELILRMLKR